MDIAEFNYIKEQAFLKIEELQKERLIILISNDDNVHDSKLFEIRDKISNIKRSIRALELSTLRR